MKINNLKINSIIINWQGYFQFAIFMIHSRKEKALFGIYKSSDLFCIDFLFMEFPIWIDDEENSPHSRRFSFKKN